MNKSETLYYARGKSVKIIREILKLINDLSSDADMQGYPGNSIAIIAGLIKLGQISSDLSDKLPNCVLDKDDKEINIWKLEDLLK